MRREHCDGNEQKKWPRHLFWPRREVEARWVHAAKSAGPEVNAASPPTHDGQQPVSGAEYSADDAPEHSYSLGLAAKSLRLNTQ